MWGCVNSTTLIVQFLPQNFFCGNIKTSKKWGFYMKYILMIIALVLIVSNLNAVETTTTIKGRDDFHPSQSAAQKEAESYTKTFSSEVTPKHISGILLLESDATILEMPAKNIVVGLYDLKGKEIQKTQTNGKGEFLFNDLKQEAYTLKIISDRYLLKDKREINVEIGTNITLKVIRK